VAARPLLRASPCARRASGGRVKRRLRGMSCGGSRTAQDGGSPPVPPRRIPFVSRRDRTPGRAGRTPPSSGPATPSRGSTRRDRDAPVVPADDGFLRTSHATGRFPSTRRKSAGRSSAFTARRIASREARRMFSASISSEVARAIPNATASAVIHGVEALTLKGGKFFWSRGFRVGIPRREDDGGGDHRSGEGPLPASVGRPAVGPNTRGRRTFASKPAPLADPWLARHMAIPGHRRFRLCCVLLFGLLRGADGVRGIGGPSATPKDGRRSPSSKASPSSRGCAPSSGHFTQIEELPRGGRRPSFFTSIFSRSGEWIG